VALDDDQRARLAERFPAGALARPRVAAQPEEARGEVVIVMGIPGAGKTRAVAAWTARGYERLNRDERGGSLRALAGELERRLAAGASRVVLDNTYPTLAGRADVISIAWRHGLPVRCVWLDTPPPQAQANLCLRLVAEFGRLPGPEELRSSRLPGVMAPTSHMRAVRQMDAPREDEGFASIEVMAFVRERQEALRTGTIVALDQPEQEVVPADTPLLALGWQPGATSDDERAGAERLARELGRPVDVALCPHAGGPPVCWCRPPLPGLVVAWALRRGVDLARVRVAGDSPTLRTLARAFPG
jgi:predicted kinase